jgi:arylsulfatase A-like enzyme
MTPSLDRLDERGMRLQSRSPDSLSHRDITGPRTLEKFTAWLKQADDRPLFVFLHLWDVHYDYTPPQRYLQIFDPDYEGSVTADDYVRNQAVNPKMAARDLRHVLALYDGEIRFADDILGQILSELDRRRGLKNTLIVVTADHGEEFFEHGWKGHQRTLFDEVVCVPLIVCWPGHVKAGLVVEDQVRLIDLMPTLLSLAGVPLNTVVQGRDLAALLRQGKLPSEAALCELLVDRQNRYALRTNEWKVIIDDDRQQVAYFDLRASPDERYSTAQTAERVGSALAELKRVRDASIALRQRIGGGVHDVQVGEEMRRQLESLGYIGGQEEETAVQSSASQPGSDAP